MGILDFFSKKNTEKKPSAPTNTLNFEELKAQVFDCIDRNHFTEFELLCQEFEPQILRAFPEWKKAPEEVQLDKDAMRKYAYCLMVIASYFQKQRGKGELMTMLTGIDDTEYSRKWQEQLGYCKSLMQQELKFVEAIPLLEQCLDLASGVSGAGVDKFLPLTLGFLGECYFQKGEMDKAAEYIEKALQCTTMQGDYEASIAYLHNLYEINRYMGDQAKAAEHADTIANKAYERGELVTASNWRHHSRSAENEPLHRVVLKIGDELFELNEIPKVHGERVEFIFVRNRLELVLCSQKCWEGRELTQQGNYEEALKVFQQASELDAFSPQPKYMSGNIKLAGRRYAEAIVDLEEVEKLCPGFETSRSDLWLAKELNEGKMEHDACMVVYEANNEQIPIEERLETCKIIAEKYPHFAEAHWRIGKMHAESKNTVEALAAFKKGAELAVEADVKSRLLRDVAILEQNPDEKRKFFKEAIAVENGNCLAQAMACYMLRQLDAD